MFDQTIADLNEYNDGLSDRGGARSNDTWTLNQLYAGLPLKDEPPELADHNHFDLLRSFVEADEQIGGLSTASTSGHPDVEHPSNGMHYMLRNTESPPLNLSQVIDWTDYFANTTTTTTSSSATETKIKSETDDDNKNDDSGNDTSSDEQSIRIKSEPDLDIDDRASDGSKNSTSGFSSNVELTEEVTNC